MSGNSSYFKLGLFLIIGLALLVGGVVVFGAGALFTQTVTIETGTTESVVGLDVGAQVKLNGVTVGKVSKIEMAMWRYPESDPVKRLQISKFNVIEMQIQRKAIAAESTAEMEKNLEIAIQMGMRVRMASSGLTGPAYLEVAYLNPDKYPPNAPPWTPVNFYLPSAPSAMRQFMDGIDEVLAEFKKMQLPKLSADLNTLINTTDTAITDLKTSVLRERAVTLLDETNATMKRVHTLLADPSVDQILKDVAATTGTIKNTVNGEAVQAVIADLPKITGRLRSTTERLDQIMHDPKLQKTLDSLNTNTGPAVAELRRILREVNLLMMTQQHDMAAAIANLRKVMENGAAFSEDFKNNPPQTLFGAPPPRFNPGDK